MAQERRTENTQAIAAQTLGAGGTVTAAARDAKVGRRTVQRWIYGDPKFRAKVAAAAAGHLIGLRKAARLALEELHERLADPDRAKAIETRDLVGIITRTLHHEEVLLGAGTKGDGDPEPLSAEDAEAVRAAAAAMAADAEEGSG